MTRAENNDNRYVITKDIDCPVCIAKAGEDCIGDGGYRMLGEGHYARSIPALSSDVPSGGSPTPDE